MFQQKSFLAATNRSSAALRSARLFLFNQQQPVLILASLGIEFFAESLRIVLPFFERHSAHRTFFLKMVNIALMFYFNDLFSVSTDDGCFMSVML